MTDACIQWSEIQDPTRWVPEGVYSFTPEEFAAYVRLTHLVIGPEVEAWLLGHGIDTDGMMVQVLL